MFSTLRWVVKRFFILLDPEMSYFRESSESYCLYEAFMHYYKATTPTICYPDPDFTGNSRTPLGLAALK
jgi:hypothetical protein